ncbi:MAG TPA: hypothetical protein VF179_30325 [Thermoanaerobaculia bacterium]|nr:hypothetical protein [Thermoanaerobaculia bacterium]
MQNSLKNLAFALEKYPERVEIVPIQELVTESARKNDKRPAFVKLSVPDDIVKQLRGRPGEDTDLVLLVRVPKEVLQRQGSLIVLPGEVR